MTEPSEAFEVEADDVLESVIDDAIGMSPTLMPIVTLAAGDPHDLFESFDDGRCSEERMKHSGLFHNEEALEL